MRKIGKIFVFGGKLAKHGVFGGNLWSSAPVTYNKHFQPGGHSNKWHVCMCIRDVRHGWKSWKKGGHWGQILKNGGLSGADPENEIFWGEFFRRRRSSYRCFLEFMCAERAEILLFGSIVVIFGHKIFMRKIGKIWVFGGKLAKYGVFGGKIGKKIGGLWDCT